MTQEEAKKYLDRLNLIFYGIIAVPLLIFSYLYLENHAGRLQSQMPEETLTTFQYIFPLFIFVALGSGIIITRTRIRRIDTSLDLKLKLKVLQSSLIVRYAHFEGAGILALVLYYLTTEKLYAVLFIITLMFLSLNRPTAHRIISNLNLKGEEKELFNKVSL